MKNNQVINYFLLIGTFFIFAPVAQSNRNLVQCGKISRLPMLRIVGGNTAHPNTWPWMVSIRTQVPPPKTSNFRKEKSHDCGGVIIAKQWVLTAAHCLDNKTNPNQFPSKPLSHWTVTAGMHTRISFESAPERWQSRGVRRYFYHEYFRDMISAAYNDIALLQLDRPLQFSTFVRPICLPRGRATPPGRNRCHTAGWGTTAEKSEHYSIPLREVSVPIINSVFCRASYKRLYNQQQHLCAGDWYNGQRDSCKGDSGGPLACLQDDGSWYVAGVVSWGFGCGQRRTPGVYTKVRSYEGWILRTLIRNAPPEVVYSLISGIFRRN